MSQFLRLEMGFLRFFLHLVIPIWEEMTLTRSAKLSSEDIDEVILVGGSTHIPAVQELVRKQTGKEPNVTVNPDEVVALGAAVQNLLPFLDVSPKDHHVSLPSQTSNRGFSEFSPQSTRLQWL